MPRFFKQQAEEYTHENKFLFKQYGAGLGLDLRHSHFDYAPASKSYRGYLPDRDRCAGINFQILKLLAQIARNTKAVVDLEGKLAIMKLAHHN